MKLTSRKILWLTGLGLVLLTLYGCNALVEDTSAEETRSALSVEQTAIADRRSKIGTPLSSADQQATRDAMADLGQQDTGTEGQPAATSEPVITDPVAETVPAAPPTETSEPPTPTAKVFQADEFEEWMKSANILLFEDIIAHQDAHRYVRATLDEMGLSYKDDGSAKGWLRTDILAGAPDGQPWDLVIIAAEAKTSISGASEYFEYVITSVDRGSSVIMEVWYLNQVYVGSASEMMSRCGIRHQADWSKAPPAGMVMFPLAAGHPILTEPNTLSFTDVTSYWWDPSGQQSYDIGDRVEPTGGGDATLLVGTNPDSRNTHGTLTVCMDGKLILQTFSSHQLTYNAMGAAWENYIYQALKTRYMSLQ